MPGFPPGRSRPIMVGMGRSGLQMSVAGLLGLTACVALNFWLFRVGFVAGLVGLNLTKHVGVAVLCQSLGVNRPSGRSSVPRPHAAPEDPGS